MLGRVSSANLYFQLGRTWPAQASSGGLLVQALPVARKLRFDVLTSSKGNGRTSMRVTLADVAARARVSTTTVSLILSDREQSLRQFHPETIRKVRESAKHLGYRANLFASGLPTKSSRFFALVIRDLAREAQDNWHHWAFEGDMLSGVLRAAGQLDLYPILATLPEEPDEASIRALERVIDGGVFGTIVRAPIPALEKALRARLANGQRIVVVSPAQPSKWPHNAIDVDNVAVAQMAADLLAAQGRKKWAVVRYKNIKPRESHVVRTAVFQRAAERAGATVEIIRLPRLVEEVTREDLARLQRMRIDGIFAVDSVLSVCTLPICMRLGWKLGEDLSMVGVNCSKWRSSQLPRITSVDISWVEAGMSAVRALSGLGSSGEPRFDTVLIQPRIIPADTCPVPAHLLTETAGRPAAVETSH